MKNAIILLLCLCSPLMAQQRVDFSPMARVKLVYPDGRERRFPTGSTSATAYAALRSARTAATSGSTIYVGPGTYVCSSGNCNLIKDEVDWFFFAGADVSATTTTVGGIFDDSEFSDVNGAVQCQVMGHGIFRRSGATTNTDTHNVVLITKAATEFTIHGHLCSDENATDFGIGNSSIRHAGGTLYATFDQVLSINGVAYWWDNGDSYLTCQLLKGHSAIYVTPNNTGGYEVDATYDGTSQAWVSCQDMVGTCANAGAGGSAVIHAFGPPEARAWIRAENIIQESTLAGCIEMTGDSAPNTGIKLYILETGKLGVPDNSTTTGLATVTVTGGELWLNAQKITCATHGLQLLEGTAKIKLMEIEDIHNNATSAIRVSDGDFVIECPDVDAGTFDPAGAVNGAYGVFVDNTGANPLSLRLIGMKIQTRGVNAGGIFVNTGDTAHLEGTTTLGGTSTKCLEGGGTAVIRGHLVSAVTPTVTTLTYEGLPIASTTLSGVSELATAAEINTGSDTGRAVSVNELRQSDRGKRVVSIPVSADFTTNLTTGDGKNYWRVPAVLNGWDIIGVAASVTTASSSGTPTFQIHNVTDAVDVLSTALTIDANETDSSTAAVAAVINTSNDGVQTGEKLRIDCDVAGTGTKGAAVEITLRQP